MARKSHKLPSTQNIKTQIFFKKMKPATWITKETWFYLFCSKVNVPVCPQSDIYKTQELWKRGGDPTTLESFIQGVRLLPFALSFLCYTRTDRCHPVVPAWSP